MPLSQSRAAPRPPCSSKVCRSLFGPVDHQQLQSDVQALLRQQLEAARRRWNFDFEAGTPLEGRFAWERVPLAEPQPRSPARAPGRSHSLRHQVPAAARGACARPEAPRQDPEPRAASPPRLKRRQASVTDFYSSRKRITPTSPSRDLGSAGKS